jgi:methionyl aminopeptidase
MNEKYKQDFLRAGALAKEVRAFGKSLITKGASYNDVIAQINGRIISLGAKPAFPPQIALNEVAAHFLPQPNEDIIFNDEVIKLDIGVCFNGAIGDCAVTVDLSGKFQPLVDAVEAALLAAEQIIRVGLPIREIGRTIERTIASRGFASVKNLSGHGLGKFRIHTAPSFPNYDDGNPHVIKPGMTFAIEPFGTNGKGLIHELGLATIFSVIGARPIRSDIAKALLSKIKDYQCLPFAVHDLISDELSLDDVRKGLNELQIAKVIYGYPPLVEVAKGMVAQAENSVLVDSNGKVHITTR